MNTCMTYIGEVKFSVNRASYRYRNSGQLKLFEIIARALAGQEIGKTLCPEYLHISSSPTSYGDQVGLNIEPISTSNTYKTTANVPSCLVVAAILSQNLKEIPSTINYAYIHLFNSDGLELAIVSIDASLLRQVSSGRQGLIEWELRVTNKEGGAL